MGLNAWLELWREDRQFAVPVTILAVMTVVLAALTVARLVVAWA